MAIINNNLGFTYIYNAYVNELVKDMDSYMSENAYRYFDFCNELCDPDDIDDAFDDIWDEMSASDDVCGNGFNGYRKVDAGRVASAFFDPTIRKMIVEQLGSDFIDWDYIFGGSVKGYIYFDCIVRSCVFSELNEEAYDMFADLVRNMYQSWKENAE